VIGGEHPCDHPDHLAIVSDHPQDNYDRTEGTGRTTAI
jgi:hypothetical protein